MELSKISNFQVAKYIHAPKAGAVTSGLQSYSLRQIVDVFPRTLQRMLAQPLPDVLGLSQQLLVRNFFKSTYFYYNHLCFSEGLSYSAKSDVVAKFFFYINDLFEGDFMAEDILVELYTELANFLQQQVEHGEIQSRQILQDGVLFAIHGKNYLVVDKARVQLGEQVCVPFESTLNYFIESIKAG